MGLRLARLEVRGKGGGVGGGRGEHPSPGSMLVNYLYPTLAVKKMCFFIESLQTILHCSKTLNCSNQVLDGI